ncbi:hypothetical protein HWI79_2409 [Cryptosporidium felis]|nr:hypothetical protein HWI79_2409 [Cryptosporidium felis]
MMVDHFEKGSEIILQKEVYEEPKIIMIDEIESEVEANKENSQLDCQSLFRSEGNTLVLKELNPCFILQGGKFTSQICGMGEVMGQEELDDILVTHNPYDGFFSMPNQDSENQEIEIFSNEMDEIGEIQSQQKSISDPHIHTDFGFFRNEIQESESGIMPPQCYHHQIRSSGLDKFTAVDRNGKRSILHEVETQAQLMPSIPGVYFDRRQIGYRVRYHNSYVGWVALSRHSSIKDAYEYAKQLWLKARNKSKIGRQIENLETNDYETSIMNRNYGMKKRRRYGNYNGDIQFNSIIYKSKVGENSTYFHPVNVENEEGLNSKYFNVEYGCRPDEYGFVNPYETDRNFINGGFSKQIFEESSNEVVKLAQYSALETMKKLYFATQAYIEKWPSNDGHYTIYWSNTSDLSSYLFGEDCEKNHRRDFGIKKSRSQRKVVFNSEKENKIHLGNINLRNIDLENKKELVNFNYLW